jgi:hypothetical protein
MALKIQIHPAHEIIAKNRVPRVPRVLAYLIMRKKGSISVGHSKRERRAIVFRGVCVWPILK